MERRTSRFYVSEPSTGVITGVGPVANSVRQSRRFLSLDSCHALHASPRVNTRFAARVGHLAIFLSGSGAANGYQCRGKGVCTENCSLR
jgi:hypothetical protein